MLSSFIKVSVYLHFFASCAFAVPLELDKFTPDQLKNLQTLKGLAQNVRSMKPYMTEDYYLAKFLLEQNFDVDAALELMEETVAWRTTYNMDNILQEDWKEMRQKFPYSRDTFDKAGRPIVYVNLGDWDVAGFLNDGNTAENSAKFIRYWAMIAEESDLNVRELRAMGRDVTQYTMLINLAGFRTLKHGCIQCLYAYRDTATTLHPHFPYTTDKNVLINVPLMFKVVYQFLGEKTQQNMKLYGQDRSQWEPVLLELISPDQIPHGLLETEEPKEKDNVAGVLQWRKEL